MFNRWLILGISIVCINHAMRLNHDEAISIITKSQFLSCNLYALFAQYYSPADIQKIFLQHPGHEFYAQQHNEFIDIRCKFCLRPVLRISK